MNSGGRKKELRAYIQMNVNDWFEKFGSNLQSVRLEKKTVGRLRMRQYAIVFYVRSKLSKKRIQTDHLIPENFEVQFSDGKKRRIKSDVVAAGNFKFQASVKDQVVATPSGNAGTLGLLLSDNQGNVYGLTNFHVAAEDLMHRGTFVIPANGVSAPSVRIGGALFQVVRGEFNNLVDFAIIHLGFNHSPVNRLPDGTAVGISGFVRGPIPASLVGKNARVFLGSRKGIPSFPVVDINLPLQVDNHRFQGLIAIPRCSKDGDSGSLVTDENTRVLGIVLGRDDHFTYLIPYFQIDSMLSLNLQ